jgi:hypothetical protein
MKNFVYMVDRTGGRVVMLQRRASDEVSYTFLPDFRSWRLARVTLKGVRMGEVSEINLYHASSVVRIGIMTALGCDDGKIDAEIARLVSETSVHTIEVEA